MAVCRSTTPLKTPRFSHRFVRMAKKPSTALIQDARWREVERPARMTSKPLDDLRMLVGGVVVHDGVDGLARGDLALDGVEEADELLMPVALHAAADDLALQHVQRGEQGARAVTLVVVLGWTAPDGIDVPE